MYCPNCGKQNDDSASFCIYCSKPLPQHSEQPVQQSAPMPAPAPLPPFEPVVHVPNYLIWAIIATALLCLPFGIPAIIYSAQANAKAALGDFEGAKAAASIALIWCWVASGSGLLYWIVYGIFMISAIATVPFY